MNKTEALEKYHITTITQKITYKLFICIEDLETFMLKNKNQFNHAYLLY